MSASSGLGPLSAAGISGSSAMPQIGQAPGPVLPDFGMHRAGVDGAFDHRLRLARAQIFLRVGDELGAAARIAEIIGVAAIVGAVLGGMRIDRHAADRIEDAAFGRRVVMVMMLGVMLMAVLLRTIPWGGI